MKQTGFNFADSKKSLLEVMDEVKNSTMPHDKKVEALIACGLRAKEVADFLNVRKVIVPKPARKYFSYTFGVEIECVHAERNALENAGRAHGVEIRGEHYNHVDNKVYFKIVSDSSVHGDNPNEVVSPVLRGNNNGFTTIKKAVAALDEVGAYANVSCGLHVHIGAEKLSGEQYVNVFKNYQKLESLIDSFMSPSRRGNCRWAGSLAYYDFSRCHNQDDVQRVICTRYCKVNPMAYNNHKTIEFRQHQGTTNYQKIEMWVKFVAKLVGWSRTNVLTSEVHSIQDVPFLNDTEKAFFDGRVAHFAEVAA